MFLHDTFVRTESVICDLTKLPQLNGSTKLLTNPTISLLLKVLHTQKTLPLNVKSLKLYSPITKQQAKSR